VNPDAIVDSVSSASAALGMNLQQEFCINIQGRRKFKGSKEAYRIQNPFCGILANVNVASSGTNTWD
jgi:hypothetical protein